MKHKSIQPSTPIPPANDKPLIPERERGNMEHSYKEYTLSEDERQAIIEKYGAPTKPPNRTTLTTSQGRVRPSLGGRR